MRTAVAPARISHTLAPAHDEWSISISSTLLCWPEDSPVSSSGDLVWAIAFVDPGLAETAGLSVN